MFSERAAKTLRRRRNALHKRYITPHLKWLDKPFRVKIGAMNRLDQHDERDNLMQKDRKVRIFLKVSEDKDFRKDDGDHRLALEFSVSRLEDPSIKASDIEGGAKSFIKWGSTLLRGVSESGCANNLLCQCDREANYLTAERNYAYFYNIFCLNQ